MALLNEDTLVQATTADYLKDQLGWESIFAYNSESFGKEGTLGRASDREVVLTRHLGEALMKLNPGFPNTAYQDALRQITEAPVTENTLQINFEQYELIKSGVQVQFRNAKGELEKKRLRVIDFDDPENNHFLCVRELWVRGDIYRRRADIVGFVNGLPLMFIECKTIHKDIRHAYEQNLSDYKDTIPHLFHHNAFVILGNGVDARIGSVSSKFAHFNDWKRLAEDDPGVVDMETLLKGICNKRDFLDLFENYTLFDESDGKLIKILARNHQFLGVNRAIEAVKKREERQGKLGVFWHTQGSGKSYSIVFFARKIHRKLGGNFTFLICTDREDLDGQIYNTFAGCGLVDNDQDPCRAGSGHHLKELLHQHKAYVFTLVQKFNKDVDPDDPYSDRDDVIVITDEAHRTQYGRLSLNLRNALPNASYIGFTGTPLFKDDEITRRVFGEYVSTYDFQRAVEDHATVPLYYDARGEKLGLATNDLNEKIAAKLEEIEIEDQDVSERLERELKRDYHIITAQSRLEQIAEDFVDHYSVGGQNGKAMMVCIDKITCVRMQQIILEKWQEKIAEVEKELPKLSDEQAVMQMERKLAWMRETIMAVVVSEEQGEVDKFRKWDLDITPHRRLIKEGFETVDGKRLDMESAFKKEDHPFRVAIVCAMWLTGFDVPTMSTLYLDKPLKAHTLMQAIARANRVAEGKNNGLIVDYCGILKNLRKALATFAGHSGGGGGDDKPPPEFDPVKPEEELLADLEETIETIRAFLAGKEFRLEDVLEKTGFERNKVIIDAKEVINQNDETRKRFEIICREVFKKFKACLTIKAINNYRSAYDAINIIYKSLKEDVEKADISDIMRKLHAAIEESIEPKSGGKGQGKLYDISKIDFDRLRREFERSPAKNTTVQSLKEVIEKKLLKMLMQNPTRTDFQKHYEEIVDAYNNEKDRVTIEATFEALIKLVDDLSEEEQRAVKEGLSEDSLALFDLLLKPDLSGKEIDRIKTVSEGLYKTIREELDRVQNFSAKQSTRDEIKVKIKNFLWDEKTGLPESFNPEEVEEKTEAVFVHLLISQRNGAWMSAI
ncbi:Type I site-specific deoxyribonuclease, R subunit [Marinobacter santoriniensis NKSG1]|uniref:Type I restriction enzyme endonuclease subunit n=1 Tax=Marinobacter santoriniensis NKSG1 TaxID=1288826 RepID=M7D3Q0_9GAMM|nr:type I restriction endonuclease subunit R [Marinobacter santoriniensis]EMP55363.1 Type I site-specific deoxyribonuclease, R subunit [Marinobacter santoriniensis NKSG1]